MSLEQEIEQEKEARNDIILSMLKKKLDKKMISEITGKTIKEINQIAKELN